VSGEGARDPAQADTGRARRRGSVTSKTRATILRSAEQIIVEQGYAAVTYRSVATRAEVTFGLVHYYFPSLDDLFIALIQADTERIIERFSRAAAGGRPLHVLWEHASGKPGATLMLEFLALANNRKAIRPVIGVAGDRIRQAQLDAIAAAGRPYEFPAAALAFLMTAIPRMIDFEESFGTVTGHAEAITMITRFLDEVEPR
jgi:AcrR family transcriptional regulator